MKDTTPRCTRFRCGDNRPSSECDKWSSDLFNFPSFMPDRVNVAGRGLSPACALALVFSYVLQYEAYGDGLTLMKWQTNHVRSWSKNILSSWELKRNSLDRHMIGNFEAIYRGFDAGTDPPAMTHFAPSSFTQAAPNHTSLTVSLSAFVQWKAQ